MKDEQSSRAGRYGSDPLRICSNSACKTCTHFKKGFRSIADDNVEWQRGFHFEKWHPIFGHFSPKYNGFPCKP